MTPQTPAALRERADEVERLRSDVARLTAERNALRATVDRLRPVVEALAEGCDRCAEHATRGDVFCATRQRDILTDALGPGSPGTWRDKAAALRALLATPAAVADGPLDTSMATDPDILAALRALPPETVADVREAAEPAPPLDDRIRVVLALFDDEEAELTEDDVRPLLEEALHATLDRRDLESCLDRIRATCEAAGIPGETREPSATHPDDRTEDITTKWSTDKLVERLAAKLAAVRARRDDTENRMRRARESLDRARTIHRDTAAHGYALDNLAALRALPPETVADVREAAERVRRTPLFNSRHTAQANADCATRLSALADLLDAHTTEPR